MNHEIWEFLINGQHRVIRVWFEEEKISSRDRAKMDVAVTRLRTLDFELIKGKLLAGPVRGKIFKLRLRCENRELRPLLCRGPIARGEYSFLLGALEVGDKLRPHDAEDRAGRHHDDLVRNPGWRKLF